MLVLLLAAWALTRAAEEAHRGFLLLSMALIGLGFNVKMLAAFVVLPTFVLVYWLGAPTPWRRRLVDVTLAAIVVVAVSLPWAVVYDVTPADRRPFAGSSRENSHGLDPILTPEKLARMVEAREVRFVMLGDLSLVSRRMGGLAAGRPIADWVRANGTLVDPALWRASVPAAPADEQRRARRDGGEVEPGGASGGVDGPAAPAARAWRGRAGGMQLFDLRADLGIVPASSTQ